MKVSRNIVLLLTRPNICCYCHSLNLATFPHQYVSIYTQVNSVNSQPYQFMLIFQPTTGCVNIGLYKFSVVPSSFALQNHVVFPLFHSPSLGYSSNINCQSRQQGSMYGAGGGTPLVGHTPGPCQASRLPPHNPRLHAPPKHGHVRQFSLIFQSSQRNSVLMHGAFFY